MGQLGHPLEYFNGPGRRALGLPDFPDAPDLQIEMILRIGATANGIYAVKIFASHLHAISESLRSMDLLPDLRFVSLSREDVLGQAISWARALQTAQYRSTQPMAGAAIYNADLIQSQLLAILRERAQWDAYFARTGIQPLKIVYERFVQDPAGHVGLIAALMEIDQPAVDERKIDLVTQRDALSEEWRERFRRERGDPNVMDVI